jgi:hypothetical protein
MFPDAERGRLLGPNIQQDLTVGSKAKIPALTSGFLPESL